MDANDVQYLIKFTRCPRCQAYSLQGVQPGEPGGIGEEPPDNRCVCSNCGTQYVFQGNTLKEKNHLPPPQQPGPEIPIVRKEKKNLRQVAVFLLPLLVILIAGILLLRSPGDKTPKPVPSSLPQLENAVSKGSSTAGVTHDESEERNGGPPAIETPPEAAEKTGTTETRGTIGSEVEEADKEKQPSRPGDPALEPGPGEKPTETANHTAAETVSPPVKETPAEAEPGVSGENTRVEPRAYKIADSPGIRIRKSAPDHSAPSKRWYFHRKTITIKRSDQQRVYLAGGPTGKRKWAVDDEVFINGERIKGLAQDLTGEGYIPDSKQLPPYEITHLVPADRETVLDIRLVDYGIFWGNTSLYIVVI